jgi:hypothetical protein
MGSANRRADRLADGARASIDVPKTNLVIGTLSWARKQDDHAHLSRERFLSSIAGAVNARSKPSLQLLLCAGHGLASAPQPRAILDASGGAPVVYETDNGDETRSYRLAVNVDGGPRSIVLRNRQLVVHAEDATANNELQRSLVDLVARRAGVIDAAADQLSLVLMICGENNAVHHGRPASVMAGGRQADLSSLKGRWILLNPAHRAYGSVGGGRVKVEAGQYGHGPMLGHLAATDRTFNDGTRTPEAVIHCNTYYPGPGDRAEATRRNASVAFSRGGAGERLKPSLLVTDNGRVGDESDWIHVRYSL